MWNIYNRVNVLSQTTDTTASRMTTAGVTEPTLNSTSDRTSFVVEIAEDSIELRAYAGAATTSNTGVAVTGLGLIPSVLFA